MQTGELNSEKLIHRDTVSVGKIDYQNRNNYQEKHEYAAD